MEWVKKMGNFFEKNLSFGAASDRAHRRRERQQQLNVGDNQSIVATRSKRTIPFRRRRRRGKVSPHIEVESIVNTRSEKSVWQSWRRKKGDETRACCN